jgi:hypothetical protein
VVDPFWGGKKEEANQKNELYGVVWSARGEERWGWRPGVVVDGSGCGEVIHGGAVLRAWSNRSERGQSGLSTVAQWRWEWWHSGGRKAEEEKVLHCGGWAPFIAARGGGRQRRGSGEAVGGEMVVVKPWAWARQRWLLSEGGRRGQGAVGLRD